MAKYNSVGEGLEAARIAQAGRHLFLCLGPDCAPTEEGQATWDYLKRRCVELNLPVMRTKAGCFRVCVGGPWLVIYPEGTWYGGGSAPPLQSASPCTMVPSPTVARWGARTAPGPR